MTSIVRRNRPGTTRSALNAWPEQSLQDMDSTFATQQYIQQQVRFHLKKIADIQKSKERSTRTSAEIEAEISKEIDTLIALPEAQDADVWQYEQLRQFCHELNGLVMALENECSAASCPQMKATDDFLYLCAAHKQPQECSAIDYIVHTLDSTAAQLNSNKLFPSRVTIQKSSTKHFQAIARRLYRIFAHAYFHHKEMYDKYENQTFLTSRFVKFSLQYELIPEDLLTISNAK